MILAFGWLNSLILAIPVVTMVISSFLSRGVVYPILGSSLFPFSFLSFYRLMRRSLLFFPAKILRFPSTVFSFMFYIFKRRARFAKKKRKYFFWNLLRRSGRPSKESLLKKNVSSIFLRKLSFSPQIICNLRKKILFFLRLRKLSDKRNKLPVVR